ncbi:MAG: DHA2 family efflux MFS transporter permease subunit [Candidatus Korobacteraceae bacterium]
MSSGSSSAGSASGAPPVSPRWRPSHNPWAVAMTVTLATFMEVLDTSIANVALPHIAGSLSAGQDEATWVLTSYLVSNAIVLPISAWCSDRFGRKRFYMSCVLLFTISSLFCGLSTTLPMLIFFRVLQGAGGGGLGPSEQAILADTFPPSKQGMGFAMYGMAVVLAPAIGPTLGGYITDNYSWHWIFFINVPVGILSLYLSSRMVEDPPWITDSIERAKHIPVDYMGLGLIAVGLGALQVVLDKGQRDDWLSSHFIQVFTFAAVFGLLAFIIWEMREPNPVLNLRLLKNRNLVVSNLLMFTLGSVLYGTTVLIPLFLQTVMGYTAKLAGEALSPGGFVVMAMMPIAGFLVSRVDARKLITFGFVALGLATFHISTLNLGIDFRTAMLYRVYQSIGLAFLFVPINTICYVGVPQEQNNQISSMINLMRNLGGSFGISFVTTMLARRSQVHQTYLAAHVTNSNTTQNALQGMAAQFATRFGSGPAAVQHAYAAIYAGVQQQAAVLAYEDTLLAMTAVIVLVMPLVLLARRPKPGEVHAGH